MTVIVYSMQIASTNISEQAASAVRGMIFDGRLPDGERINEVHLADTLGVSRTPLREGLGRLVHEGIVTPLPKRGFFVAPLTVAEFEQLYGIRPILDPEALKLGGLPSRRQIDRLIALNEKMREARDPERVVDIDNEWHLELLAHCPNRVLVELIEWMILRTKRYELALFRETDNVQTANDDHDRIISAAASGDLEGACAGLKRNMQSGIQPIVEWLQQRELTRQTSDTE